MKVAVAVYRSVTLQNYTVVLHTNSEEESCASFSLTLEELECLIGLQRAKKFSCKEHSGNTFMEQRVRVHPFLTI